MMTRLNVSPVPFRRRLNGAAYRLPKKRSRGVKKSLACGQRSVGQRQKTHERTEPRFRNSLRSAYVNRASWLCAQDDLSLLFVWAPTGLHGRPQGRRLLELRL